MSAPTLLKTLPQPCSRPCPNLALKCFIFPPHQEFDVYGNGLIGVEDLLYVFRKLGDDEITREEVEMMIIDATGTTKRKEVTLEEFKAVSKGF